MIQYRPCRRIRFFTLVEIMVAMVVLLILMGFLFKFLWSAQQAWSLSETDSRIYENAQIAMDLICRDLRAAVASDFQGGEIPFWTNNPAAASTAWAQQDVICFAAAVEPHSSDAEADLSEVKYSCCTDQTDSTNGKYAYWLRRSVTSDKTSSGTCAEWNFYGVTSGDSWIDGQSRDRVIDGVKDFRIDTLPNVSGTRNELPRAVRVTLTLVDARAFDPATPEALRDKLEDQTCRTFTRMIFLGAE